VEEQQIKSLLQGDLKGWLWSDDKLRRSFEFKDFVEAFAFMSKVALHAEKNDHHPEWSNVWNRVEVNLCTHDAGDCVTQKDVDLALIINQCV